MIARFTSIADFVAVAPFYDGFNARGGNWDAGVSGPQIAKLAIAGDTSLVPMVTAEMDKFETQAAPRLRWAACMAGTRADVPAYLAGSPMAMRKRKPTGEARSLRIYVSNVGAALCSAQDMMRRGAAILGMLETLTAGGIHVDLYVISDLGGAWNEYSLRGPKRPEWDMTADGSITTIIPIETRPLDLSTAAVAIAHPAFYRHLAFGFAKQYGFNGSFSPEYEKNFSTTAGIERYCTHMRTKLGLEPSDVFVPRVSTMDSLFTDPAAWIQERVAQALAAT